MRHGQGVYIEGDYSYEGEWFEDKMHGEGVLRFASGAMYKGTFAENKYAGEGTYSFPDGTSKYVGLWENSRMHGMDGVYTDKESHEWKGQFYNGSGPGLTCQL